MRRRYMPNVKGEYIMMKFYKKMGAILGMAVLFAGISMNTANAEEVNTQVSVEQEEMVEIVGEDVALAVSAEMVQEPIMVQKVASTTNVSNLGYWVYRPSESTEEELPLIVYMHGIGERGSNLNKLLGVSLPKHLYQGDVSVNAVVIAPQCPSSTNWTKLADDVMELIEVVKEQENIDETSISLTGHSLGGIGTWNIALKYPEVFASLVPVSSTISTPGAASTLADIPIWSFHGSLDTMTPTTMLQAYSTIQKAGGEKMQVTMFEGQGHCITDLVYNNAEFDVLNWMASQHRTTEQEEITEENTEDPSLVSSNKSIYLQRLQDVFGGERAQLIEAVLFAYNRILFDLYK